MQFDCGVKKCTRQLSDTNTHYLYAKLAFRVVFFFLLMHGSNGCLILYLSKHLEFHKYCRHTQNRYER